VRSGRLNFADFWARRARRILPAATLLLVVRTIGVVLLASPPYIKGEASDIAATTVFMVNWQLARHATDYFAQIGSPSDVLHYWSLAVEEQFYLFWPVLIGLCVALVQQVVLA